MTQTNADAVIHDTMPRPTGYRILIRPVQVKERSDGGIILAEETKRAQEYLRYIGEVVAMGELCYRHTKFRGDGDDPRKPPVPWCKVGDTVAHGQYAGQEILVRTATGVEKFRLVNDDEILAVVSDPESVLVKF